MSAGPAELLGSWWPGAARDLPWRRTRDPWAVLVAETMLQQTQVERVRPRRTAFLRLFPDPAACAAAPPAEVIGAWSGLGYYRRAVALHRCARAVVERHAGRLPPRLDELLALPGVGPYTARAVLAFSVTEADVGVVDVNAGRVLARAVAGRRLTPAEAQRLADDLVPPGRGWAHNQAMLDLGAGWCRPVPRCGDCPLAAGCRWHLAGAPAPDPAAGSAGARTGQSRFEGSDRQGRGRLLAAMAEGPVPSTDLAEVAGWPSDGARAARVADGLVADGLAGWSGDGRLALPSAGPR